MEALTRARTERVAAVLLDQYRGALSRSVNRATRAVGRRHWDRAAVTLDGVLQYADFGRHLLHDWRVVLAGPPNAGKSTLINTLVGYQRALVHEQAGTTRDVVTVRTILDGWPVELADTAGLRPSVDALESAGIGRARRLLDRADLILAVHDATQAWSRDERNLLRQDPPPLLVHSKSDLLRASDRPSTGVLVSATQGQGIATLIRAILARLVPHAPGPGQAVPFLPWHVEQLRGARSAIERRDAAAAHQALAGLCSGRPPAAPDHVTPSSPNELTS
jgi:tRNA modification GTPase